MTSLPSSLPESWTAASIQDIAEVNPKLDKSQFSNDLMVSFVPMPAVEANSGHIDISAFRQFGEVKKGYTSFREGDVLFAKITPCMENGKMAVAPALKNDLGFGSTEFHVIRPHSEVVAEYIYFFVASQQFRADAEHNMTGAVGQRRVPAPYLSDSTIPLPPTDEQHRIVAKIEELFSELDKGIESLKTAREQLKVYRQAVLKHAFEGKLTAQWREQNKEKLEISTNSLENGYRRETQCSETIVIPDSWNWCRVENLLLDGPSNGRSVKDRADGFPVLRLTALKDGRIDLSEYKCGDWKREAAIKFLVQPGDFLLSRGNGSKHLVGRGGVVPEHEEEIAFPDTMVRLRVDPQTMHIDFFDLLWNSRIVRSQIESNARTTAGIYKINQAHIKGFQVPVPSLAEQETVVSLLERRLSVVEELGHDLEYRLAASESLRQSILKKAFSGQLVPQDPDDEPASALLERIKTEKNKQAPKRKPRKRKAANGLTRREKAAT